MSSSVSPSLFLKRHLILGILLSVLVACVLYRDELIDHWILGIEFPIPSDENGSIVITGTSSGIGRETCGYLAERHARLNFYCGVRSLDDGREYPFTLPNVKAVELDVTNPEQIHSVLSSQLQSPLVGIVSNAGIAELGTLEFQTMETFERHFQVNLFGTLRFTKLALPALRQTQGRIVWISSASAKIRPYCRWGAYQSSKAAMGVLGGALRQEVASFNISVSIIEPGFVATKLIDKAAGQSDAQRISQKEQETYPHIYNPEFLRMQTAIMHHGGPVIETCQAIDDALFSPFPKTHYITSRITILPTWLFIRVESAFPTHRFGDWFNNNLFFLSLAVKMLEVQKAIDEKGILGLLSTLLFGGAAAA